MLFPFVLSFGYPLRIILAHAVLGSAVLFILFLLINIALTIGSARRLLVSLLLTFYFFAAIIFFAVNYATNLSWGAHLSLDLILSAPAHVESLLDAFPQAKLPFGIALCIAAVFSFMVADRATKSLLRSTSQADCGNVANRLLLLLLPIVYLAGTTFLFLSQFDIYSLGWFKGEPLAELFHQDLNGFVATGKRVEVSAKDAIERRNYPKNLQFEHRNVILIIVDAMRASNMGIYGYNRETTPFLRKLAENGNLTRISNVYSPCPESICGIMSTFTSKDFSHMSHSSFGLQNILHNEGYKINLLLSGDHHWYGLDKFYGQDIDLYRDGRSECEFGINDDRCVIKHLEQVPDSNGTPQVFGFHLMSVHAAGIQLQEWQRWMPASRWRTAQTSASLDSIRNGYDNGILQADNFISRIFELLEQKGYLKDSIVIISADHGEALGEHNILGHGKGLWEVLLHVPLIIYDERKNPLLNNPRHASLMDVAPTVLDILKLPIPKSWQGISLLQPEPNERVTFHQTVGPSPEYAVFRTDMSSKHEYISAVIDGQTKSEELYDLNADPEQQKNLASTHPDITEALRNRLLKYIR